MNLPVFDGTQSLNTFLTQLHKEVRHMPEHEQFKILCLRLHGEAASKVCEYFEKDFQPTLAETISTLQQLYPESEKLVTLKICNPTQQQHQSIFDFSRQVRKRINHMYSNKDGYCSKFRERMMIDTFIRGVHPDSQKHIIIDHGNHQSFTDIVRAAETSREERDNRNNSSKHKPQ